MEHNPLWWLLPAFAGSARSLCHPCRYQIHRQVNEGPGLTSNLIYRTLSWSRRRRTCQVKSSVTTPGAHLLPEPEGSLSEPTRQVEGGLPECTSLPGAPLHFGAEKLSQAVLCSASYKPAHPSHLPLPLMAMIPDPSTAVPSLYSPAGTLNSCKGSTPGPEAELGVGIIALPPGYVRQENQGT